MPQFKNRIISRSHERYQLRQATSHLLHFSLASRRAHSSHSSTSHKFYRQPINVFRGQHSSKSLRLWTLQCPKSWREPTMHSPRTTALEAAQGHLHSCNPQCTDPPVTSVRSVPIPSDVSPQCTDPPVTSVRSVPIPQ